MCYEYCLTSDIRTCAADAKSLGAGTRIVAASLLALRIGVAGAVPEAGGGLAGLILEAHQLNPIDWEKEKEEDKQSQNDQNEITTLMHINSHALPSLSPISVSDSSDKHFVQGSKAAATNNTDNVLADISIKRLHSSLSLFFKSIAEIYLL